MAVLGKPDRLEAPFLKCHAEVGRADGVGGRKATGSEVHGMALSLLSGSLLMGVPGEVYRRRDPLDKGGPTLPGVITGDVVRGGTSPDVDVCSIRLILRMLDRLITTVIILT